MHDRYGSVLDILRIGHTVTVSSWTFFAYTIVLPLVVCWKLRIGYSVTVSCWIAGSRSLEIGWPMPLVSGHRLSTTRAGGVKMVLFDRTYLKTQQCYKNIFSL